MCHRWYREMSPNVELELERVCEYASALSADANLTFNSESAFIHLAYDEQQNAVFLYVAQNFHLF